MLEWIAAHYDEVLAIIGGIVSVASLIVKLTPTTKDDAILAKIVSVLEYVSIVNKKAPK